MYCLTLQGLYSELTRVNQLNSVTINGLYLTWQKMGTLLLTHTCISTFTKYTYSNLWIVMCYTSEIQKGFLVQRKILQWDLSLSTKEVLHKILHKTLEVLMLFWEVWNQPYNFLSKFCSLKRKPFVPVQQFYVWYVRFWPTKQWQTRNWLFILQIIDSTITFIHGTSSHTQKAIPFITIGFAHNFSDNDFFLWVDLYSRRHSYTVKSDES